MHKKEKNKYCVGIGWTKELDEPLHSGWGTWRSENEWGKELCEPVHSG